MTARKPFSNARDVAALVPDPAKADEVVWAKGMAGFGVRLRGARKSWIIQYRIHGRQRRESLGDVHKVELDAARRIAKQRFAKIELGQDPAAERARAKAAAAATKVTVGFLADGFLAARQKFVRPSTFTAASLYLTRHWKPLRDRPAAAITRADVAACMQGIVRQHGPIAAARARTYLLAAFKWGMGEGLVENNPVIATDNPGRGARARSRVLSDQELIAVWKACAGDSDFDRIVRLLILLGTRRQEIGSLTWSELDLDAGTLTLPAHRSKNHHALELPLSEAAVAILRSVPRRDSDYVFGDGKAGFTSWSPHVTALKQRLGAAVPPFVLHDLRRSFRTGLGRLGVRPDISELLLNHVKTGVSATYDRYSYHGEKHAALALWAEHIIALAEGRKPKLRAMVAA
jgi:integrase